MTFATGILIWLAIGVGAALLTRMFYRGPTTTTFLAVCFDMFGALVGGMLGVSFYVAHDPSPFRVGGLIGTVLGATLFSWTYNAIARKFI
ncbi:MAG TPA: hypothetical protein VK966_06695 [Longimicrobiales bacterium]|nr:hypothetical protein [Longimicrobiales bacterium]